MLIQPRESMAMGQWAELASAFFAADGAGGGGTGGGTVPGMSPIGTSTTVSPTFQQSFTPQVSPVIQVSQGGGEQRGATSQVVTGGQEAQGGAGAPGIASDPLATATGPLTTSPSSLSLTPSYSFRPADATSSIFRETFRDNGDGVNWLPWIVGGTVAVGVIAYAMKQQKRKGRV